MSQPQQRTFSTASSEKAETNILTKTTLAKQIAETYDLSFSQSQRIVNTVFDSIMEAVDENRPIRLHKFGTFYSFMSKERDGVNPATKAKIHIPSKRRIRFKASDSFFKSKEEEEEKED